MFQGEPNIATYEAMQKAYKYLLLHDKIVVSLSGGSDSDIMLDLLLRVAERNGIDKNKLDFVFFDTGIEMVATKNHIRFLEMKYGITIHTVRASVPVPNGIKNTGLPFISKDASDKIYRLQNHGFDFRNDGNRSYEELMAKYKGCKAAIGWWCNKRKRGISCQPFLKEFMIENPPTIKISDKCCYGAKKRPSAAYAKQVGADLTCIGVRRAEGGVRVAAYRSCFDDNREIHRFRPIFWFTDKDKTEYRRFYKVTHSEAYTCYGFTRTGCAGCPFSSQFEENLKKLQKFEPKLAKAAENIFGQSYEYMRQYQEFKRKSGGKARIFKKPSNSLI